MAFFGGLSGWSGSSWSEWSGLGSDSDSESEPDTATTTTPVVQTSSTSTPNPTTATATVVQQVTTTAVSIVTPSTTASTPKAVAITQTSKPSSGAVPSTTAKNNAQTSQQQQQASQVSQVGSSSIAGAQPSSSTSRPSSSSSATPSSSTNSTEDVGDIPGDWIYFGCVPNNNGMPALNTTYATSDELTPVLCITACAASQYHYAGLLTLYLVENGNACFCGSTMTTSSISSSSSSSSSCNMDCTGDPSGSYKCGGPSSMSFYHLKSIDPNSSSSQNQSSSSSTNIDGQYGDSGSGTVVVSLPEFTGTLMEYGDPRFRSGKDGVVFGEMFKISSSSSRYRPDLNTKLEGLGWVILLGWVGLRILR
ncbi:hypothetical protein I204_07638 [Kwoniella mangroviensis CBS 8886]|nr:hypothetical protein I204_07638 [Kwoniella mangroviensis CBS 8886]